MAVVDFSNAVLDVNYDTPMAIVSYLDINFDLTLRNIDGASVCTNNTRTKLLDTPTKVSFLFSGSFTTSGTKFYIGRNFGAGRGSTWKVSNISYSTGDTYSFVIDIEVSGNT